MAIHCGRQIATITYFVKFVTTVFRCALRREGMLSVTTHGPRESRTRTHLGIEQTVKTNSSIRQFFAALSKTADSIAVSVTRAEVMACSVS